jgi:hypothetical protein
VSKVANSEIAPRHLLAVSRHLFLVRVPFLVGELALGAALLTLGDADEGVDDCDEQDGAADAGADGDLGGVGEAGPLLLGFLGGGELVECFVEFGFASVGGLLVVVVVGLVTDVYVLFDFDAVVAAGLVFVAVGGGVLVAVDDFQRLDLHGVRTGLVVSIISRASHLTISLTQRRSQSRRQPKDSG